MLGIAFIMGFVLFALVGSSTSSDHPTVSTTTLIFWAWIIAYQGIALAPLWITSALIHLAVDHARTMRYAAYNGSLTA